MMSFFLVTLGGAMGAAARYGVSLAVAAGAGGRWPWATLAVNILGGFAMGVLVGAARGEHKELQLLLGTGVLGGFTTFSAFSIESVRLIEQGEWPAAALYIGASVLGSLLACVAGLSLARSLA